MRIKSILSSLCVVLLATCVAYADVTYQDAVNARTAAEGAGSQMGQTKTTMETTWNVMDTTKDSALDYKAALLAIFPTFDTSTGDGYMSNGQADENTGDGYKLAGENFQNDYGVWMADGANHMQHAEWYDAIQAYNNAKDCANYAKNKYQLANTSYSDAKGPTSGEHYAHAWGWFYMCWFMFK